MTDRSDQIRQNAIRTTAEGKCYWTTSEGHENCTVTHYTTAMVLTYGSDKAHRITFSEHSAEPGKMYAPAGPGCGSKRAGLNWVSVGKFRPEITCGRC